MFITGLVTAILVFLQVRRCPASQRRRNRWRWFGMGLMMAWLVAFIFNPQWLERRWHIYRADLQGKWLTDVDLHNAYGVHANLQGANLRLGVLEIWEIGYTKSTWENQPLRLQAVNLRGADLRGVNLQTVEGLTEEQTQSAQTDENTKLPPYLKAPGPVEHDAAAPPREGTAQSE